MRVRTAKDSKPGYLKCDIHVVVVYLLSSGTLYCQMNNITMTRVSTHAARLSGNLLRHNIPSIQLSKTDQRGRESQESLLGTCSPREPTGESIQNLGEAKTKSLVSSVGHSE